MINTGGRHDNMDIHFRVSRYDNLPKGGEQNDGDMKTTCTKFLYKRKSLILQPV